MMKKVKILVVEDESILALDIQGYLKSFGYKVAAVADKRRISLENSGPFPIKAVAIGSEEEAVSALMELGAMFEVNSPDHRMSALQDLEHGRRLEIDETLGYAVAEAQRLGIPSPTLETCYSLLSGINRYQ